MGLFDVLKDIGKKIKNTAKSAVAGFATGGFAGAIAGGVQELTYKEPAKVKQQAPITNAGGTGPRGGAGGGVSGLPFGLTPMMLGLIVVGIIVLLMFVR